MAQDDSSQDDHDGKNISERQLAANRRNGSKSRGPKTEAGKGKSSLNAVKHGMAARTVIPSSAPIAMRAKVRNRGSTIPTVSLLPGKDVPHRTLARRTRPKSRDLEGAIRGANERR